MPGMHNTKQRIRIRGDEIKMPTATLKKDNTPREHRIIERKIAREEQLYQEYIKKDSPELALFFLARATAFKEVRDEVL